MPTEHTRRRFLQATGATGIAALAGCAGGGDGAGDGTRLSWHAGGQSGTYYPLSNEFKTIVEDNTDYSLNVQTTGASVENVGSLAKGNADFALIQNDIAYFAKNGTGIDAFQDRAVDNLVGVATLYPETITLITRADTGIETVADLDGATINTGDLGSGTQVNALQILEAAGVTDYEEQTASFAQAAEQLRNGDIDAAFVVGGWPVGAIEELANTNDIEIVPIEGEARDAAKEAASWFADDTIPSGTYSGIDRSIETVSVQAMIATHDGVDEATVTEVTSAIFEHTGDLTIKPDFIDTASAQDGMSIDLHPGAAAYFES
ncbi:MULTISPECIES: TAXI family TRAP transporter solute-binding subunit [Halobacterium]|uniref:TAXI family TRAP transporter solute-binding subunit n=1 Tax=Halobacterium TaxID=2239 RepID=UPI00196428FC|nr:MULTISPECIES: TAXI family TRAP transporter solute-binding subunit [Halobacterium]MCF2165627.1 TAXI family TRAP transporter solute-binding subunit [Halobacterium salinarum]MCF2168903.1 TAXI family TRAP transporter solute-binding subunit [Halobacterium salinarum]MCF2238923.1 TAXI family TRAP transporter solute-binding subunit [Halobacterium salinarum]MDL0122585.1 TAXI family TRAP transporter solute-binding subunit [Halobacterium salinarum]MDL0132800.1 TAXI family TRAP transporter solute-bindi